jgi:hypothetical protein
MKLFVFTSKSQACFCCGVAAHDLPEAIGFLKVYDSFNGKMAARGAYDVKEFDLTGDQPEGVVFWEEE